MSAAVRILGLDPGLRHFGYAVVDCSAGWQEILAVGELSYTMTDSGELGSILHEIQQLLEKWAPDEAAIEAVYFSLNRRTAFTVAKACGVAIAAAEQNGVVCYEYTPTEIKQSLTGYGKSDKDQVRRVLVHRFGIQESISSHEADAIATAICHANSRWRYAVDRANDK